jgi:hypothetical protein
LIEQKRVVRKIDKSEKKGSRIEAGLLFHGKDFHFTP